MSHYTNSVLWLILTQFILSSWNFNLTRSYKNSGGHLNTKLYMHSHNLMIHVYTKFNLFVFQLSGKRFLFSFINKYRRTNLRSPCDIIDYVITVKNTFSCIIWDDHFTSDLKSKLCSIFWFFQNNRHIEIATIVLTGLITEVKIFMR